MKSRRAGFTLVELLVVAVIGTIVLASVYQTLIIQEKSVRQSYAIAGTQQNVRTAMQVLSSDLREVSATGGDIVDADSTSITYRALRKAGVVCNVDPSGNWIDVARVGDAFVNGDSIFIFAEGANNASASDDSWVINTVNNVAASFSCIGFPVSSTIQRVHLATPLTATVRSGGLIRSWVNVLYTLQDVGGEGHLMRATGASVATNSTTAIIEDLSTSAAAGLRFRYWDTLRVAINPNTIDDAAEQANRNRIGRIQIKVTGTAVGAGTAGATRMFSDSLVANVYPRGNRKLN